METACSALQGITAPVGKLIVRKKQKKQPTLLKGSDVL
jgi:hypothetical protein